MMIIKLIKTKTSQYHVWVHSQRGRIHHKKFFTEVDARAYLNQFNTSQNVKVDLV